LGFGKNVIEKNIVDVTYFSKWRIKSKWRQQQRLSHSHFSTDFKIWTYFELVVTITMAPKLAQKNYSK
jgi:hypothetical protein